MSFKLSTRLFCERDTYQMQHFHTVAMTSSWPSLLFSQEANLKNAEVNMHNTHTGGLTSHWTTVNQTFLSHSFFFSPVHKWRRLSSVPEDLFRSGGLPCGSLPATLPFLPELWSYPGRQCQWDYTSCINTAQCLLATLQQALINLRHGLFGIHSFITTCLWSSVCADTVTRLFIHPHPSLLCLSYRGGVSEGCFMLLLSAGGWAAQGQAGVWVLSFFYAYNNLSYDSSTSSFNYPSLFSCFQALRQRWQRSPRQLCK